MNDRTPIVASLSPARLHHFCIAVADLDATLEEPRSRDVNVIGKPVDVAAIRQRVAFTTRTRATSSRSPSPEHVVGCVWSPSATVDQNPTAWRISTTWMRPGISWWISRILPTKLFWP